LGQSNGHEVWTCRPRGEYVAAPGMNLEIMIFKDGLDRTANVLQHSAMEWFFFNLKGTSSNGLDFFYFWIFIGT
jgi:hypothetical protein